MKDNVRSAAHTSHFVQILGYIPGDDEIFATIILQADVKLWFSLRDCCEFMRKTVVLYMVFQSV